MLLMVYKMAMSGRSGCAKGGNGIDLLVTQKENVARGFNLCAR
jgi:hypothetical protein